MAAATSRADETIDNGKLNLDADIFSLLTCRQPVAADLRRIIACSRSITDIERIGEHACNLAEHP